jgi:FkbM family methyltransferase
VRPRAWFPTGPDDAPLGLLDLAGGRASINQRHLRRHGLAGWQAETTAGLLAAWQLTSRPGAFLDVGANAGVYALLCRLLWPSMEVVAFEPCGETVEAGRRWAAANDVAVRFEQVALSEAPGEGVLYLSTRSDASHSLVAGFREAADAVTVPLQTLDGFAERDGVTPTVVKIDVEQHEPAVVRGARETLARCRPVVVMERLKSRASRQAHRLLDELGYTAHPLGARDHLYWPGEAPPRWPDVYRGWLHAVQRCAPRWFR